MGPTPGQADSYQQVALDLVAGPTGRAGLLNLHVIGDSMAPLLRPGDRVTVQPVQPDALRLGDMIVVRHPSDLITHRLVAVDEQGWHTKGDNCHRADEPVAVQAIVGRVVAIERGGVPLDLLNRRWAIANRWIGVWGRWEVASSRLLGTDHLACPSTRVRRVSAPFRALMRLAVWLLLKL